MLQVLESGLEGREFLAGPGKGKYSIADIANFCWVRGCASWCVLLSSEAGVPDASTASAELPLHGRRNEQSVWMCRCSLTPGQVRSPPASVPPLSSLPPCESLASGAFAFVLHSLAVVCRV